MKDNNSQNRQNIHFDPGSRSFKAGYSSMVVAEYSYALAPDIVEMLKHMSSIKQILFLTLFSMSLPHLFNSHQRQIRQA